MVENSVFLRAFYDITVVGLFAGVFCRGFLSGSCSTEKLVVYVDVDAVVRRVGFG